MIQSSPVVRVIYIYIYTDIGQSSQHVSCSPFFLVSKLSIRDCRTCDSQIAITNVVFLPTFMQQKIGNGEADQAGNMKIWPAN